MRRLALFGLVAYAAVGCGGGPTGPALHTQTITGTLSSVGTMAADYRSYPISVGAAGVLTASAQWVGDGALWLFVFDEAPPTTRPALAQSDQSHPTNPAALSANLPSASTYYVLVMQSIVPAGPERGACQCVDDFTLTLTHP